MHAPLSSLNHHPAPQIPGRLQVVSFCQYMIPLLASQPLQASPLDYFSVSSSPLLSATGEGYSDSSLFQPALNFKDAVRFP